MNVQLLIDSIVRQTTVLVAQLATSGGARTPLADVAGQVFIDLARELHRQGVSRKVAADMFGLALRTYRRKIQRLAESKTLTGRSLWEAVYEYVGKRPVVTRAEVLRRFHQDDGEVVRGILQDLVETGLVCRIGTGVRATYRAATGKELDRAKNASADVDGLDTLVWTILYRMGPIERANLGEHVHLPAGELDSALDRLVDAGRVRRIERGNGTLYRADGCVIPLGEPLGWEAGVFDHFRAVATTIGRKVRQGVVSPKEEVGGSTYTLEIWPGHPLEAEVRGQLTQFRERLSDLRSRVAAYNRDHSLPHHRHRVIVYAGQSFEDYEEGSDEPNP